MPADFRVSITDAKPLTPIPFRASPDSSCPARIPDAQKGGAMKTFLEWMLADGQGLPPSLLYPPLPQQVIDLERKALDQIAVGSH
jgi:hypothetical protein